MDNDQSLVAGGSGLVAFDGETSLASPATSVSHTLSDGTKNKYIVEARIVAEGTGGRVTQLTINGLSTAIYDYEHDRFYSGGTKSSSMAQAAAFGYVDNQGAAADGDHATYTMIFTRIDEGWAVTVTGSRISSTTHVTTLDSFFIAAVADLASIAIAYSANNLKATSNIRVWSVDE